MDLLVMISDPAGVFIPFQRFLPCQICFKYIYFVKFCKNFKIQNGERILNVMYYILIKDFDTTKTLGNNLFFFVFINIF